ncbi:gas vesicle protein GvpG [Thalassolituus hydrocarboniclasticus]|uniref:Antitoxin VbhA domain-containing protein n=1 Tax=Thalassolituus hydrocarboniclasticus TaxID=2742796 RepID=A0ABY6AAF4_9GAMM|nr:gas vesicle protein GvpG [Thalassolituus hydrocarboniclasticus]UXD87404.1 hypothetical protein HUF19_08150 [Thalassolituus hydrocarboniclasticus]
MTARAVLNALEANRRYTDLKDAEARLSQARRDLDAGAIDEEEYSHIADVCRKIIRASSDG